MSSQRKKWSPLKIFKTAWAVLGLTFLLWLAYSMQAHGVDPALLRDSERVKFEETDDYYVFTPTTAHRERLIFFPGALVDPEAYVPLCSELASHNLEVHIIKMPWRQAALGYEQPIEWELFGDTSLSYYLAGHPQGGKMAARFVHEHPALIDKLILIGTTHPRDLSLAPMSIPILKVYGTHDGIAEEATVKENRPQLPASAIFKRIDGANHSQFGYYGFQLGDNTAAISRAEQHAATVSAILDFLRGASRSEAPPPPE